MTSLSEEIEHTLKGGFASPTSFTPTETTLVGIPYIDDRGRVNASKWLEPGAKYAAHRFLDGSILLKVIV